MADPLTTLTDGGVAVARGGGLVLAGSAATMLIQFASLMVLSRLLAPADFGLVATAGVIVALGNLLVCGLPVAALDAPHLTHQRASNLFWMNLGLAAIVWVVLAAAAPLLAGLYSEPRLTAVVPAISVVMLVSSVGAQIQVHLAKRMQYRVLVGSDVVGQAVALGVGVLMATGGYGYWALIAQSLTGAAVPLAVRWSLLRWVPCRPRRGHGAKALLRAGAEYGLAQLLTFLQANVDTLVVGARLGAGPLGFYNRAYQLLTGPASRLMDPLTQVVVPGLNRLRASGHPVDSLLNRIQFAVGFLVVGMFSLSAGTAPALIPLFLGPGWEPTVTVFQILAIGGSAWVFTYVNFWVFVLSQQSRELLRYNLFSKPVVIALIIGGSYFGIQGVAWGYSIGMVLSWPLGLWWLARKVGLDARPFAWNGCVVLVAGTLGAASALVIGTMTSELDPLVSVMTGVVVGGLTMVLSLLADKRSRHHLAGLSGLAKLLLKRSRSTG